jgi:hypothetical protein
MMLAHFLALLPQHAFFNIREVYTQDLDSSRPNFEEITNVLYVFLLSLVAARSADSPPLLDSFFTISLFEQLARLA